MRRRSLPYRFLPEVRTVENWESFSSLLANRAWNDLKIGKLKINLKTMTIYNIFGIYTGIERTPDSPNSYGIFASGKTRAEVIEKIIKKLETK